jgi:ParB-like chromosome segregation protein Spo0J
MEGREQPREEMEKVWREPAVSMQTSGHARQGLAQHSPTAEREERRGYALECHGAREESGKGVWMEASGVGKRVMASIRSRAGCTVDGVQRERAERLGRDWASVVVDGTRGKCQGVQRWLHHDPKWGEARAELVGTKSGLNVFKGVRLAGRDGEGTRADPSCFPVFMT